MAHVSDRLLSDYIDAWNAGRRPDVDDYLAQAPEHERAELADALASFLAVAPTPAYSDETLREIRAEPAVVAALGASPERSGVLPALLRGRRERLGLSIADLAGRLVAELGLAEGRRPKTTGYLERWEQGELASARVSRRVFEALSRALGIPSDELEHAADFGAPAAATVFRSVQTDAPQAAPHLELLADALETPGGVEHDEVDDLFLSGR